MSHNPIRQALEAAKRHPTDTAVNALVDKLRLAQATLSVQEQPPYDQLAGYRRGAAGDDGYGLMHSLDTTCFQTAMRDMSTLREIAVIADCLIAVLATRGEDIVY